MAAKVIYLKGKYIDSFKQPPVFLAKFHLNFKDSDILDLN